jgi:hypothetical protein
MNLVMDYWREYILKRNSSRYPEYAYYWELMNVNGYKLA